ncbi:hypothetical protein KCP73_01505 [Salmonella enterica subsp. enterica]|nr:hypothetical protein KCP73_01505 [Salmonella enterica subsp. enterica]
MVIWQNEAAGICRWWNTRDRLHRRGVAALRFGSGARTLAGRHRITCRATSRPAPDCSRS